MKQTLFILLVMAFIASSLYPALNEALFRAIKEDKYNNNLLWKVELLLYLGANPNATLPRGKRYYDGWTALQIATAKFSSNSNILESLLRHGALPDIKTPFKKKNWGAQGWTALHLACSRHYDRKVKTLLKYGADANARIDSRTALHIAANNGIYKKYPEYVTEIVITLLNHGADVNALDSRGYTPLHYASEQGFKLIIKVLLEKGADINTPVAFGPDKGKTPLDLALKEYHSYNKGQDKLWRELNLLSSTISVLRKLGGKRGKTVTAP